MPPPPDCRSLCRAALTTARKSVIDDCRGVSLPGPNEVRQFEVKGTTGRAAQTAEPERPAGAVIAYDLPRAGIIAGAEGAAAGTERRVQISHPVHLAQLLDRIPMKDNHAPHRPPSPRCAPGEPRARELHPESKNAAVGKRTAPQRRYLFFVSVSRPALTFGAGVFSAVA